MGIDSLGIDSIGVESAAAAGGPAFMPRQQYSKNQAVNRASRY